MAATEVLIVDNGRSLHLNPGTDRVERYIEQWCKELKTNIVNEFLQFRSVLDKENQRTINEIQSKTSPEVFKLRREIENLRELLHTLERSVSQKDKLVSNLVKSLEKEKEKYEKLKAVSTDQWNLPNEELNERTEAAKKLYSRQLLRRCWTAWRKSRSKDRRNPNAADQPIDNTIDVKLEDHELGNESLFSDNSRLPSDTEDNDNFGLGDTVTSTNDFHERSYPAYQTNDFHPTKSEAAGPSGLQSFTVINSAEDPNKRANQFRENVMVPDIHLDQTSSKAVPVSRPPSVSFRTAAAKARGRKRAYAKSAYDRGKRMYDMKGKLKIKKVRSLRNTFMGADGRPTMATNAFQSQGAEQDPSMQVTSMAQGAHIITHDGQFNNQNIIINPHQQPVETNIGVPTSIVQVQPQFGANHSDWEAAKNNISQYMNQMLTQGDSNQIEKNREAHETMPAIGATTSLADASKKEEHAAQASASTAGPSSSASQLEPGEGARDHFQCPSCSRRFIRPVSASRHVSKCMMRDPNANGRKNHECQECSARFSTAKYLRCHIRVIHRNISKHRCNFCKRAFANALVLQNHTRTHTGDRPFVCIMCDKAFTQLGSLNKHKRTHTGDRPFVCSICDKAFTQLSSLNRHMKKHF